MSGKALLGGCFSPSPCLQEDGPDDLIKFLIKLPGQIPNLLLL